MEMVRLNNTGQSTSRLGFGCSSIMGALNRRDSLLRLEWAYDAGIRHFDVAPMYGFGEAEACLGEFLARHSGEVTVTTKYGIAGEAGSKLKRVARLVARPLVGALPALKALAQRGGSPALASPRRLDLSPEMARHSLEQSLRKLRVERIDVFLLHDATLDEVRGNDALLDMLKRVQAEGKIGAFGVGTDRDHAEQIVRDAAAFAPVVQREWSVFNGLDQDRAFHITHRALRANWERLRAYLQGTASAMEEWSKVTGVDLRVAGALSELMMRSALWANPSGVVLFSSKDEAHIRSNARLAEKSGKDHHAEALYRLVQRDLGDIPLLEHNA